MLWFGAAVSIAEILTGALIAPLGFSKGITAIMLGHVIGCILLYLAGLIGADSNTSAMESVRFSFGYSGSVFFSVLNILQLVGWTAVMIIGGAKALGAVANSSLNLNSQLPWCILIGVLIIIWVAAGIKNLNKLNNIAVIALFFLTILLSTVIFKGGSASQASGSITFGMAVELSAAMPLSWLPLISDYTKNTDNPKKLTLFSTLFYFIGSCWMYIIGLGAAIFTGDSDIAKILMAAGFSVVAMIIVILSTVTTTFLDVYSASVSAMNISKRINEKWLAIGVCIVGTIIAMFTPIEQYQNFLYLIGSVFAPMIAILITDYFILKNRNAEARYNITNFILWVIGFIAYRMFLSADTFIGSTLPVMIVISVVCIVVNRVKKLILAK